MSAPGTVPCPGGTVTTPCGNPIPAVVGNTICTKCGATVHVYLPINRRGALTDLTDTRS